MRAWYNFNSLNWKFTRIKWIFPLKFDPCYDNKKKTYIILDKSIEIHLILWATCIVSPLVHAVVLVKPKPLQIKVEHYIYYCIDLKYLVNIFQHKSSGYLLFNLPIWTHYSTKSCVHLLLIGLGPNVNRSVITNKHASLTILWSKTWYLALIVLTA